MAYKALYRTYRPTTFDEVAGQQHIVKTLKNALKTGKIAHAYLFAGPRGTGKTTMAKLLAKALNCDEGVGYQCNECKNCKAILDGSHPDVLEIDAASNNGVDEIRDIIDKVKYSTILGRYKVYIIDEVHMMTPGAFNALLKTLEEPPEHVIFILATTEPHKILPTILSRCQRYDFTKVSEDDIRRRIKTVLESENVPFNLEAVNLIISLADGGMRDALSILDQVLAYTGDHLNVDDILDMFALESIEEKMNLLVSISNGNISDILTRLNDYVARGTDIKRLTNDLLMMLKDLLIYQTSHKIDFFELLSESDVETLNKYFDEKNTLTMVETLMTTLKEYKNVSDINPLFEVTLLKLASLNKKETNAISEPIKRVVSEEAKVEEVKPVIQEEPINNQTVVSESINTLDKLLKLKCNENDVSYSIDDDTMIKIMVTSKKDIKTSLLNDWKNIKRLTAHPSLGKPATLLIDSIPLVASNKVLILESQLTKNVENLNKKSIQQDLQNVIYNAFGKKMFIFAVSRNDSIRLQKAYMDKFQLGLLPKADEINLEFEGE